MKGVKTGVCVLGGGGVGLLGGECCGWTRSQYVCAHVCVQGDDEDNCRGIDNPKQEDNDNDRHGDACDPGVASYVHPGERLRRDRG
jgi:hypothetical protein